MSNTILVSIVIPTHNRLTSLQTLLGSIRSHDFPKEKMEIIVVNDASTDDTAQHCREQTDIIFLNNDQSILLSAARNQGAIKARGKYVFFMDDDNILPSRTISMLVEGMEELPKVGMMGPIMYFYTAKERIWCSGAFLRKPWYSPGHMTVVEREDLLKRGQKYFECDYLPNAYLVRKEAFDKIGGFDEILFPFAWEDIDFGERLKKAGYKVLVHSQASIWHDCPVTTEFHLSPRRCYFRGRSKTFFYKKYHPWRLLFTPIDILGFMYLLLVFQKEKRVSKFAAYLSGIWHALTRKAP